MRFKLRVGLSSSLWPFGRLLGLLSLICDFTGADAAFPQDEYLRCFQNTLGVVSAEREDHAPAMFSGKTVVVFLPAVREKKKGFYLFTQYSAFFQPVVRAGKYYVLHRPGHAPLKFSVEKEINAKEYEVKQLPSERVGIVFSKIPTENVFDKSARASLSDELQKRITYFSGELDSLEHESKRLHSTKSFLKGRLENIDNALQACELILKDKPLQTKVKAARKKLDHLRSGN